MNTLLILPCQYGFVEDRLTRPVDPPIGENRGGESFTLLLAALPLVGVRKAMQRQAVVFPRYGMVKKVVVGYLLVIDGKPQLIHRQGSFLGQRRITPVTGKLVNHDLCIGHRLPGHPVHHEEVVPILSRRPGKKRQIGQREKVLRQGCIHCFGRSIEGQHVAPRLLKVKPDGGLILGVGRTFRQVYRDIFHETALPLELFIISLLHHQCLLGGVNAIQFRGHRTKVFEGYVQLDFTTEMERSIACNGKPRLGK